MLTIGQILIYRQQEICRVESLDINFKDDEDYYKLVSINDASLIIRIPRQKAQKTVRPLLSKAALNKLLENIPNISHQEKHDEASILGAEDDTHEAMIRIIKSAYTPQEDGKGKKQNDTDRSILRRTEKILYSEIATVLGMSAEKARSLVMTSLA